MKTSNDTILDPWIHDLGIGEATDYCTDALCSSEAPLPQLGVAGMLSLTLGSVGIVFNIISLLAITQVKRKITTHFRLIASLTCSDLLMDISVICHQVSMASYGKYLPGLEQRKQHTSLCLFMVIKALNSTGVLTTLLNLLGMAIDHYIGVMKPFHYHRLLGRLRGCCMILCFWVLGILLGYSDFYAQFWSVPKIQSLFKVNFCEAIWITTYQEEYWVFGLTLITGVSMVSIYVRIYTQIQTLRRQEMTEANLVSRVNRTRRWRFIKRQHKSLATTCLIVCSFLMCWMPICVLQVTLSAFLHFDPWALGKHVYLLQNLNTHSVNLLLLNTIMDPVIYAVRVKPIRNSYRRIFVYMFRPAVSVLNEQGCCRNMGDTDREDPNHAETANVPKIIQTGDETRNELIPCAQGHLSDPAELDIVITTQFIT